VTELVEKRLAPGIVEEFKKSKEKVVHKMQLKDIPLGFDTKGKNYGNVTNIL
jgi:hypothetical protein